MSANWIDDPDYQGEDQKTPFAPLAHAQRQWNDNVAVRYRIYKTAEEFVVVEAATASIALQLSEVSNPVKIERWVQDQQLIVNDSQLTDAVGVYVRPVLETLTQDSPIIHSKVLNGLVEASNEAIASTPAPVPEETAITEEAPLDAAPLEDITAALTGTLTDGAPIDAAPVEGVVQPQDDAIRPPSLKDILAKTGEDPLLTEG